MILGIVESYFISKFSISCKKVGHNLKFYFKESFLFGIEQRKSKRYKFEKWVKAWVNGKDINCRILDLSETGLGISKSGVIGIKSHDIIIVDLVGVGKISGVVTWAGQISFGVVLRLDITSARKMEDFIKTLASKSLEIT